MAARCSRPWFSLSLTLLAAVLLSCSGGHKHPPSQQLAEPPRVPFARNAMRQPLTWEQRIALKRSFAHVLPPQAYAALEQLGMLVSRNKVGGARRTSVALPYLFGAEQPYSPGDAGYIGLSSDASVSPSGVDMAPASVTFPGNFSYAIYRVDDVVQIATALQLNIGSTQPGTEIGVAAYNWNYGSLGRWEPLYYGAASPSFGVDLGSVVGANWVDPSGDFAFVVFCLNPAAISLNSFELSGDPVNAAPFADLIVGPDNGTVPLNVLLDASGSFDSDGAVAGYRFDPLGDGNWVDNGSNAQFVYDYTAPAPYHPVVEVTDDIGAVAYAQATVIAGPQTYDEIEENDFPGDANLLPAIPFAGYSGNCGLGGDYDGDEQDWFKFNANAGDEVSFLCEFSQDASADFTTELLDANLNYLASSFGYPPQPVNYTVHGTEPTPFFIAVLNASGLPTNYFLKCDDHYYHETEDNDDPTTSSWWADLSNLHSMINHRASLGSGPGYPGYDGDSEDWFSFQTSTGYAVDFTISYDSASSNIGVSLFDSEGDLLANSADGDGDENINYSVQPEDLMPLYVHCAASSGFGDYYADGTIVFPNPGFDEQEDNDTAQTANVLPAFPFSGFSGNVGASGSYDGDTDDYFQFEGTAGDMLKLTITLTNPTPGITITTVDSENKRVSQPVTDSLTGVVTAGVMVTQSRTQPFVLYISDQFGDVHDYLIDGEVVATYDEVENNDSVAEASPTPAFPFFVNGNMGPSGNDGDSLDYFSFGASSGQLPRLYCWYDTVAASIDFSGDPPLIYDADGDVMATGENGQDVYGIPDLIVFAFDNPIGPADTAPFYCKLNFSAGSSNYWLERYE